MKDLGIKQALPICRSTGKAMLRTKAKAVVFANRLGRNNKRRGDRWPVHAFKCAACDCWHVGHKQSLIAPAKPQARASTQRSKARRQPVNATEKAIARVIKNWWSLEMVRHDRTARG